jgi:large subunit ribosomal protein L34
MVYSWLIMSQTYQPKKKKRAKTHGFLVRGASKNGKNVLKRRRQKGRKRLSTV